MRLFLGSSPFTHFLTAREWTQLADGKSWIWVRTKTLDGLVARLRLRRVDFLRMDVEGAEVERIPWRRPRK